MSGAMPEAAAAFCAAEYPRLVGGLALYVGDVHVAEEFAQEALLRACRRWEYVSGLESPGGWTWRVALNLANSAFRRRGAERRAQARRPADATIHIDADPAEATAVRRAVAALPQRQRTALVLRYGRDVRHLGAVNPSM
ncbi:MAG: SigE family RNA polymerase sigma factor [Actinobacteria bacterium]|nr:SigE family RNA polymerase sigma factor [Actinomycetota bacterium]